MRAFAYLLTATVVIAAGSSPAFAQRAKKPVPTVDLTPSSPDDILPPQFHGSITYRGIYKGRGSAPSQMQTAFGRRFEAALGVKMLPMAGEFTMTITFNGNRISGSTTTSNGLSGESMTLDPGKFIGTRDGVVCHLQWTDGSESTDYCGRSEYRNVTRETNAQGQKVELDITAPADEVVDLAERERNDVQVDAPQAPSRGGALPVASSSTPNHGHLVTDASGNPVLTTAATGLSLNGLLDLLLRMDSQSWMMNSYTQGSASDAKYLSTNKGNTTFVAQANYQYSNMAGGGQGWMKVKVEDGHLVCLEFWDQAGNCRQPWQSLSQQRFVGFVGSMMSGGGASGGRSGDDEGPYRDNQESIYRQAHVNDPPPPEPKPVEPIAPLYGVGPN